MNSILTRSVIKDYESLITDALQNYKQTVFYWKNDTITNNLVPDDVRYRKDTFFSDLSVRENLLINRFSNYRDRGLMAAKLGDLVTATSHFAIARTPLNKCELTEMNSLLYESFLEQAESFLFCKQGKFRKADNSINKSLSNNMILEDKYPHIDLTLHQIQLIHNFVRLEVYRGNIEYAVNLACQILAYLDGGIDFLPMIGRRGQKKIENQSPGNISAMYMQISGEIAIILAGKSRQDKKEIFFSPNNLSPLNKQSYHPIATDWFALQKAFVSNNIADFLKQAARFLLVSSKDSIFLFSATLIDLITICKEFDLEIASVVKKEIAENIDIFRKLPNMKIVKLLDLP
jgi:hypothetical protein